MTAFTARMGMYLPGGGSMDIGGVDEIADVDRFNQSLQKLDAAIGVPSYGQSALPAAPFPGEVARVSETGDILFWNSSQGKWGQVKPHVGDTPPASPSEGDLWVDTSA